jgi:hypothetical protein
VANNRDACKRQISKGGTVKFRDLVCLLFLFLLAGASSARADNIVQITGDFSADFVTNSGVRIIEDFSTTYQLSQTTRTLVPGTMSFTSTGNLGTFTARPITNPMFAYWDDQLGNVIQLDFAFHEFGDSFPAIQVCDQCGAAFFWIGGDPQLNDSISVQPIATPEPTSVLCLLSVLPLAFVLRRHIKSSMSIFGV